MKRTTRKITKNARIEDIFRLDERLTRYLFSQAGQTCTKKKRKSNERKKERKAIDNGKDRLEKSCKRFEEVGLNSCINVIGGKETVNEMHRSSIGGQRRTLYAIPLPHLYHLRVSFVKSIASICN